MNEQTGFLVNHMHHGLLCFRDDLIQPIIYSDNNKFESILKQVDIKKIQDARDWRGNSLLHIAAECNNGQVASYLIRSEFDVNVQNEHGQTALGLALKRQNFAVAKVLLVESYVDIFILDTLGYNVLRLIVAADPGAFSDPNSTFDWHRQYWPIVALILDKIEDKFSSDAEQIADYLIQFGCPLTHVIFIRNSDVLKIMIEKGSSINIKDRYSGRTALHSAVQYWKLDKVKILLEYDADFHALDYFKKTPMMCLYDNVDFLEMMPPCEVELVQVLLQHKNKLTQTNDNEIVYQMYPMFRYGSKDGVAMAIKESADDLFLAKDENDFTLLHVIAENLNPGIEEVIRGRKVDLNGKSKYGQTALGHAIEQVNCNVIKYLLSEGATTYSLSSGDNALSRSFIKYPDPARNVREHQFARVFQCIEILLEHGEDQEILSTAKGNKTAERLESIFLVYNIHPGTGYDELVEPILAQLAIRKVAGAVIPKNIYELIRDRSKTYFISSIKALQDAKTLEIFKSVTVYDILIANNKVISLYARNKGLVSSLSKLIDHFKIDSYYMKFLLMRYSKIIQFANLREEAEEIINYNIGKLYEYNAIVTETIVKFLDDSDVKQLLC